MSPQRHTEIEDLLAKLDLIEEQARLAIEEFPAELRAERQRRIIELARELREVAAGSSLSGATGAPPRFKLILP